MLFHNSIFSDKFFAEIQAEISHYFETKIPNVEAKIKALSDWYEALRSGKVGKLTEKQQQGEFLDLLFETVLGYEKKAEEWKLQKEYTFENGAEADGVLGFFSVSRSPIIKVAIELKGLRIDLDKRQNQRADRFTPVQQAFHYAYQAKETCEWVIVSNFDEIRLYHASDPNRYESFLFEEIMLERHVSDKKEKSSPAFFAQKYPNLPKFFYLLTYGQLYNVLDKGEKSEKGDLPSTKQLYTNRIKRLETITFEFYLGYKKHRKQLYEHILSENPNLGLPDEDIFNLANTIFDRLIFMRFAEEIGIFERKIMMEYLHFMRDIPTDEPVAWFNIRAYFRSFDKGYREAVPPFNGELFKPSSILEQMVIQNAILIDILVFLKGYDFKNELKVDILGHIFEQSLNDNLDSPLFKGGQGGIRNQDGIFYTPEYITDFMIGETLMTYLEEHKQLIYKDLEIDYLSEFEEDHRRWAAEKTDWTRTQSIETHANFFAQYKIVLQNVKILDPACGSGAFLTRVFDYLLKENELVMNELDKFSEQVYEELIPEPLNLSPTKGKKKNTQDMFLLQEAKENKKGRKLAILGNEILLNNLFGVDINQESVEITKLSLWLKTANKHKISLVDLSKNIKIGNSLISDKTIDRKAFEWEKEFSFGKFDLVMGNPPYVRMQVLHNSNPKAISYFKENYQTAQTSYYDLYVLFVEKGYNILKDNGLCSFILPNKFFTTDYGQGLRHFLASHKSLRQLVNFGHYQVFENATIYTCTLFLGKKNYTKFKYAEVNPAILGTDTKISYEVYPAEKLEENTWIFGTNKEQNERENLKNKGIRLIDLPCQMSRGSSTGNDNIFIVKQLEEIIYENGLGEKIALESDILKKAIFATDFSRYYFREKWEYYVIFPYEIKDGKTEILSEEVFATCYPLTYQYLFSKKDTLSLRKQNGKWYEYSAARSLKTHIESDILIPLLANRGLFAFLPDNKNEYTLMAGGGFSLKIDNQAISKQYLLGLLNSKLLFNFLEQMSNTFRGGWITCTKQYFSEIPIKIPDFSDLMEKELYDQIVELVNSLLFLYKEKDEHANQIEQIENEIESAVHKLYGLEN